MKYYILAVLLTGFSNRITAQHENDRWVFGGSPFPTNPPALNFFSGTPVSVPTVPTSSFYSGEAAAAVADDVTGALLFYTDASNVYTANQALMPQGGATFTTKLNGCNSSTQGALILDRPGVPGHYYIFTVDCSEDFTSPSYSGLRLSEVDMSLNGGLGDVIASTRNTLIWGPPVNTKLTEKLTATRHTNGNDYWLVVHEWGSNNFLSFLVTCNGITNPPVISSVGTVHTSASSFPVEVIGAMKISSDRTRLALVAQGSLNMIEVFNFNASTGVVTNPIHLNGNSSNDYGVEFSPNGQRLYVTVYNPFPCCSGTIFQYNLAAGTAAAIQSSKFQVASSSSVGYGGMQLGPDNKIHVSRVLQTNNLGIINSPDNLGNACGFSNTGAPLSSRRSNIGLINQVVFQSNPVCLIPLPVDLLYFNGIIDGNEKVILRWTTSSEINNHYFRIERSLDGELFSTIGMVNGSGTTTTIHEYSFDDKISAPLVYYQLTQIDFNANSKTYPPIVIRAKKKDNLFIYFNPSNSALQVFLPFKKEKNEIKLSVFDMYGKCIEIKNVFEIIEENEHFEFRLNPDMINGVYVAALNYDDQVYIQKFIKY